jgi:hypothetical protein
LDEAEIPGEPDAVRRIVAGTQAMGFSMISEPKVGALLATLAASKPAGRRIRHLDGAASWKFLD